MTFSLIVSLLILLISCSAPTDISTGGGTATGNPYIVGVAVAENGEPLRNSRISVAPSDGNESHYLGEEFDDEGFTYTDSTGRYEFSLTRTGAFDITIWYDTETIATTVPCVVKSVQSTIDMDTVEVKPLIVDTLTGIVNLRGIVLFNYPISLKVLGTDIEMRVQNDSLFRIPLPRGTYDIVLFSQYSLFEPDTLKSVSSSEHLDSIAVWVFELPELSYRSDSTVVEYILKRNGIEDVSVEDITTTSEMPKRITSLTLTGEKFSKLPAFAVLLTNLKELTIINTEIEEIPEDIREMPSLEKLIFSSM